MKDFTHAVVRTIGEDGTSRSMLVEMDMAQQMSGTKITQMVSTGGREIPPDLAPILSWDLGGVKAALAEAEAQGILTESSSMEEIQAYIDAYERKHSVSFGLPKLA